MTTNTEPQSASATAQKPHFSTRLDSDSSSSTSETKIVSRSSPSRGLVTYTLQLGGVSVPDVSASEVTDYVSAYDLEIYENQAFEREAVEAEARQKERLGAKARARRLNKPHSDSASDSSSARDESVDVSVSGGENVRTTAGGRQRPTYTHFYPKQRAPRRSSKPTLPGKSGSSSKTNGSQSRENKRRRMEEHREGSGSSVQDVESIHSIASPEQPTQPPSAMEQAAGMITDTQDESDPMDLDDYSDDDIEMPIRQPTRSVPATDGRMIEGKGKAAASSLFTFRDRALHSASSKAVSNLSQPRNTNAKLVTSTAEVRVSAPPTKVVTSTSASTPASASAAGVSRQPPAPNQSTITTGSNGHTSSRQAVINLDDSSSDSEGSEVYSVERILAHNFSDPRSHDKDVHGDKPVMLYQVKWEGYDETTWEPATSFEDRNMLREYWIQHEQKQKQKQLASSLKNSTMVKGVDQGKRA